MARTKQTARKRLGGKGVKRLIKRDEAPTIFNDRSILEPYLKDCLRRNKLTFTDRDFNEVWDKGISNRDEIIRRIERRMEAASKEGARASYARALTVLRKVKGPILSTESFQDRRGFGKVMLSIIDDVVSGKEESLVAIDENTVFKRYNSYGKLIDTYSLYSKDEGTKIVNSKGDILSVTKRSNGNFSIKGQRGKSIDYFTVS